MSTPKNMVELIAEAKRRILSPLVLSIGDAERVAVEIAEMGVAYERERIAQQIRNRLRGWGQRDSWGRIELESLLQYVEAKDGQP